MNKMCFAYLGALLLLHLFSSQVVQTQESNTTSPMNVTTASHKNGCGTTDAFTLLLPLAAAFSLLLWS